MGLCCFSRDVIDAIDKRWEGYDYTREDVVGMVVRISRPSRIGPDAPITPKEREGAEALLAACD